MDAEPRDRLSARAPLVALIAALGCAVPDLDLSAKKCLTSDDCPSGEACASDGTCVAPPPPDAGSEAESSAPSLLCDIIPHFSGTQIVDGADDDLAEVPPRSFHPGDLLSVPAPVGDQLDVDARVAWSEAGLHMYFRVHYESGAPLVPSGDDLLWYGDAIELFLKGDSQLTGRYTTQRDVGAIQIVAVPDEGGTPRSETYVDEGNTVLGPLPQGEVAAQRLNDGYALELMIPWRLVLAPDGAPPPVSSRIGFDLGIDYRSRSPDAGADNPQYQLLLQLAPVRDLSANCLAKQVIPSCDDRTWCTPTLVP